MTKNSILTLEKLGKFGRIVHGADFMLSLAKKAPIDSILMFKPKTQGYYTGKTIFSMRKNIHFCYINKEDVMISTSTNKNKLIVVVYRVKGNKMVPVEV